MSLLSDEKINEIFDLDPNMGPGDWKGYTRTALVMATRAIIAAVLAEQEKQGPVAHVVDRENCRVWWNDSYTHISQAPKNGTPLYTTPIVQPDDLKDAERLKRMAEIYAMERDHARAQFERVVRLLTGIYALLYPPRFTDHDGRTWQFKSPLAEGQMQELSDRIRALPDEIEAIAAAMAAEKEG